MLNALLEKAGQGQGLGRVQCLSAVLAAIADRRGLGQFRHRAGLPGPDQGRVRRARPALSAGRARSRERPRPLAVARTPRPPVSNRLATTPSPPPIWAASQ
ncbi:hypothetical protein ACRAWD_08420 [Caulobacter segnis]